MVPGLVDDDGVRLVQVFDAAEEHFSRGADQGAVVEPDQDNAAEIAAGPVPIPLGQPGPDVAAVEFDRPGHTLDSADAVQVVVRHAHDLVNLADVRVHDPDLALLNVPHQVGGPGHDRNEDRDLVRDQQRREGHAEHDAEVLGPVAGQHLERDPDHRLALDLRRSRRTAFSENSAMCSASSSAENFCNSRRPKSTSPTARFCR